MTSASFRDLAQQYAEHVLSGEIPACEYVKQACKRFQSDLTRDDIYLSDDGDKWCRFLEKLPHVKGKWAAKAEKFILSDWQIFCTVNIYGWKYTKTDKRRFREAYIEVPRKNGKSFWVAGLGVGHLTIDDEFGAEVYCGASTEAQAWEVFRPAKKICERSDPLRTHFGIEVNAKTLAIHKMGNVFQPVIGKPGDGASPSCAIADEFHEHASGDQVETFTTGMGAREQPLMLYITTAGADMGGPCYEKRHDVIQVLDGAVEDDFVFGVIYTLDENDHWDTTESLKKANPNYGVSVFPDYLEGKLKQAKRSASQQVAFKTKHLNMWVGAKSAWMNMLAFQACRKKSLKLEDFKGQKCYVAIDLASKTDIADVCIFFPPDGGRKAAAFFRHYLPEDTIEDNVRYKAWHQDGWLISTPGNVTDFSYIEDDLEELKSDYQIEHVPYDPFQATQFSTRMLEKGFPMVEYGATVKNFSEPMKLVEAMILEKNIEFEFDPVFMWMMGNVVAKVDKKDNIFPDKETKKNKIDGVVALIMGMGMHVRDDGEDHYVTGSIIAL